MRPSNETDDVYFYPCLLEDLYSLKYVAIIFGKGGGLYNQQLSN